MTKNVELKAHVSNLSDLLERARSLVDGKEGTLLVQHDTFFNASHGRLKLREFVTTTEPKTAELIFYNRNDESGPKLSEYVKVDLLGSTQINSLKQALTMSVGVRGQVHKERHLFLPQPHIRIHVDKVQGLGDFMEIEVCINDELTVESGAAIAKDIIGKLGISEADLISGAYIDEIDKNKS